MGISYLPYSASGRRHVLAGLVKILVLSAISSPHESAQVRMLTIDTRTQSYPLPYFPGLNSGECLYYPYELDTGTIAR